MTSDQIRQLTRSLWLLRLKCTEFDFGWCSALDPSGWAQTVEKRTIPKFPGSVKIAHLSTGLHQKLFRRSTIQWPRRCRHLENTFKSRTTDHRESATHAFCSNHDSPTTLANNATDHKYRGLLSIITRSKYIQRYGYMLLHCEDFSLNISESKALLHVAPPGECK